MSLTEVKLSDIVMKQYKFKLLAFSSVLTSLLVTQLIAAFFAFAGSGATSHSDFFTYNVTYYSSDIVIYFTFIWAFVTSILITTKAYRDDDFTFVSSRLSSNLANLGFLITISLASGLTALMASYLIKLMAFYFVDSDVIIGTQHTINSLISGILATVLYIFLFTAIGYFIGMLVQLNKLFAFIIPGLFFGYLILGSTGTGQNDEPTLIVEVLAFFAGESSLMMFTIKVLLTALVLFTGSILVSNRMEVKR